LLALRTLRSGLSLMEEVNKSVCVSHNHLEFLKSAPSRSRLTAESVTAGNASLQADGVRASLGAAVSAVVDASMNPGPRFRTATAAPVDGRARSAVTAALPPQTNSGEFTAGRGRGRSGCWG
jgi:hypothetical protein